MTEDAVRTRFHEALARRMQAAPEAVQRVLRGKLPPEPTADGSGQDAETAPVDPPRHRKAVVAAKVRTRLGDLNDHIATVTGQPTTARAELRSAHAFRDTWSRLRAEDDVAQAVQRGPENAGPLNSHMLVLRTLGLLSELSPDYLRRFMAHADTLLWLDDATTRLKAAPAKAKATRQKK